MTNDNTVLKKPFVFVEVIFFLLKQTIVLACHILLKNATRKVDATK